MANVQVSKEMLNKYSMIKEYKEEMKKTILSNYPDIDETKLEEIISRKVDEQVTEVPVINFNNNYTNKSRRVNLLGWYDWYKKNNPITTEHGVCFKKHNESTNLAAKMLEFILNTRKSHKKQMLAAKDAGDYLSEKFHNIRQKVFKIFANSYYGATGQRNSIFFNLYTALSITGKGQSLITNAATSFEQFLADNIAFNTMDDLYLYIHNIKSEKNDRQFKDSKCLSKQISSKMLVKRLCNKFTDHKYAKENLEEITNIVNTLSKTDINRIYYKNNLYDFCKCEKVLKKIYSIIDKVDSFTNPNEIPDNINDDLKELWSWLKEFVYYPHTVFNHTNICKKMIRKTVVTVDTDSNMINTEPWIDFLIKNSGYKYDKNDDETIYKMVNIMAYILTNMIGEVHERFTADCNVPEDKREIINMKNEFLNKRMLLTENKKNYASYVWLQEGVRIADEKSLDIKGLSIKKSNVNKHVGETMQEILEENILKSDNLDLSIILGRLSNLESDIKNSLERGEVFYGKPDKSNEPESYKFPLQMPNVRGIMIWNYLYPDKEITFPAQVNTFKLKAETLFDIADLQETHPEFYNILEDKIFNNEELSKFGFGTIALPKTESKIPDWIIPYLDIEQITHDSISNFNKILYSVGVSCIETDADNLYYSNIIDF